MKEIATVILFLVLGLGFFYGLVFLLEYKDQQRSMENTAYCMLGYGKEGRTAIFIESLMANDIWGRPMKLDYEITKEYHKATVTSMGRDAKPDTKDDWKVEKFDYNNSYKIGKLASEKAKEALDGIMDGIKEKGKFEEAAPTK